VRRMEEFERFMQANTDLGATVSVVPFLKAYWGQNHFGDPKWSFIPDDSGSVRAALFQLRQNGAPGFLRPFMTDDGRYANLSFIYRDHKGDTLMRVVQAAETYVRQNPIGEVIVRLEKDRAPEDASWLDPEKWNDATYYLFGPLLPPRDHTLEVKIREDGNQYVEEQVVRVNGAGDLPPWLGEFREAAIADYEEERDAVEEGDFFSWPDSLASWTDEDVEWWWESEEHGIRAVAANETNLIVHDLKAVEGEPKYQQTQSWTRGMQFVLAGGIMGILAATNEDVERSHVANISLIFLVILVLHSITYASERLHHPAPDRDGDDALARVHGGRRHRPQSEHAAGAVGGCGHRGRLRHLHRRPHPPGGRGYRGHRRGGETRGENHRHGRELHGHDGGGRHRAVELLEPALPGRDGAAAVDPDGREHARRHHRGTDLLLRAAAQGCDGAAVRGAEGGDPHPEGRGAQEGFARLSRGFL
jgi:hypothetical protein